MTAAQEILSAYDENPNAVFSINELAKRVGKAYPSVHKSVTDLISQGVLTRTQVGRSHLCAVNFHNKHAILLLALNETAKHDTLSEDVLSRAATLERTSGHTGLLCIIYDGTSLLAIVEEHSSRAAQPARGLGMQVLTQEELIERLLESNDLYTNHVVMSGYERFFRILADPRIIRRYHPLL